MSTDTGIPTTAQLLIREAHRQADLEAERAAIRLTRWHELRITAVTQARLCDCDGTTHPEPGPLDAPEFQWGPADVRRDADAYTPRPHLVQRRRITLTTPARKAGH